MSFKLTEAAMRQRSKTVTRRLGWRFAEPGMRVRAVRQCRGLKRGEKVEPICVIMFMQVSLEELWQIDQTECDWEGFPELRPDEFVQMFCRAMRCKPETMVTRIAFTYVD